MAKPKQKPKVKEAYSFILNPHPEYRLSTCPKCHVKKTFIRKFALAIDVEGFGLIALGKTCRYCASCKLIMVHQLELEAELSWTFQTRAPEVIGNAYLVFGTMNKSTWQNGLQNQEIGDSDAVLNDVSVFKHVLKLAYDPGGWGPAEG